MLLKNEDIVQTWVDVEHRLGFITVTGGDYDLDINLTHDHALIVYCPTTNHHNLFRLWFHQVTEINFCERRRRWGWC